jgi:membrane protease YdiL (CAAX protease family)
VLLVIVETFGEIALGIAAEQARLTWLFALYSICGAPIIEELIFRGWLVIEHRGRPAMWAGAIAASALFAILHPFLWKWDDTGVVFLSGAKGWFSTVATFVTSLWFYAVRLGRWNPTRSLLPCFAAHAAKNATVVAIKAATGFIGPLI